MIETYQQFIGGAWVDAAERRDARRREPGHATRSIATRARQRPGGRGPRRRRCRDRLRELGAHDPAGRAASLLLKIADALEARADELGRLESAQRRQAARRRHRRDGRLRRPLPLLRRRLPRDGGPGGHRVPRPATPRSSGGTRSASWPRIAPWNYPLYMAAWKLGPALATGNTVVLKPSARTPLTALAFAETRRRASCRPGVLNVITGTGGEMGDLAGRPPEGPDDLDHRRHGDRQADRPHRGRTRSSGSTSSSAARRPVIVFDDADLDLAAETLKSAGYWNAGQDCTAACRVIAGPEGLRQLPGQAGRPGPHDQVGRSGRGRRHRHGLAHRPGPGRQGRGDGRPRPRGAGRELVVGGDAPGPGRRLLRADAHRRPGPEERDRPGRGLRSRSSPSSASATRSRRSPGRTTCKYGLASSIFTGDIGRAMRVAQGARVRAPSGSTSTSP